MNDEELAALIRSDGIDVLVDLGGHTGHNRLLVFARRPAAVQVTWLGYGMSTGLDAMDFRLSDSFIDPQDRPCFSSEAIYRLGTYRTYRPLSELPLVAPPPALKNGFITFGSFNNLSKVTGPTVSLWSEVLRSVGNSRMFIMANQASASQVREIHERFERHGIEPDRITVHGRTAWFEYYTLFGQADIVLDCYPFPGATTTFDALWMGVPVITLAGDEAFARGGEAILSGCGMSDWVAHSVAEYVSIARRASQSTAGLYELRMKLRERMATSPLSDVLSHTRALEDAYRAMWRACSGK